MALKHRWHNKAKKDFDDTLAFVFQEFGYDSASKLFSEVYDRIKILCTFPEAGLRYKDLLYQGKEVRVFHMRKSSIVYCHNENTLFILAFWNNRSNDKSYPKD